MQPAPDTDTHAAVKQRVQALLEAMPLVDKALLDVLFGDSAPQGKLPFDLPRSMTAVLAGASDVAFDTEDPILRFGHGLT